MKADQNGKIGRNELCPDCGLKMKYCQGHRPSRKNIVLIMALMALGLTTLLLFWMGKRTEYPENLVVEKPRSAIRQTLNDHADFYGRGKAAGKKEWFLLDAPDPAVPDSVVPVMEAIHRSERTVKTVFENHYNHSPFTEEVVSTFENAAFSVYTGNGSVFLFQTEEESAAALESPLEICLVPESKYSAAFPSHLFYYKEWGAVVMAAIYIPEKIFPALLMHELGHAYLEKVLHEPSTYAAPGSDLFVKEEIRMHDNVKKTPGK